jgi:hypothetical protein
MTIKLALGLTMILFSVFELILFVRTNGRRWIAVQALMFGEMGAMFLCSALLDGTARTVSVTLLGLATLVSAIQMYRMMHNAGSATVAV